MNKSIFMFGLLLLGIAELSKGNTPDLDELNSRGQISSVKVAQATRSNTLKAGETLTAGKWLTSANGRFILRMQREDGHLCVYRFENGQQGEFVWGTGKHGFDDSKLVMQTDGNLVVYDGKDVFQWGSDTHPDLDVKFKDTNNKPVKLVLEDDGSLNLYTASGDVVWTAAGSNTLKAGETLAGGRRLTSANGRFILRMQSEDGHLCVYKFENGQQGEFVWGSGKYGFDDSKLVMQTDGNLVVYGRNGAFQWGSDTHPDLNAKFKDTNNKPVKLVLEDDGSLNLYTVSGHVVWTNK
jgi:alpha-tubulin suppressor-like RCC1 family protein